MRKRKKRPETDNQWKIIKQNEKKEFRGNTLIIYKGKITNSGKKQKKLKKGKN